MAAQNNRCSCGPATGGRPGERSFARPARSDRRLHVVIATLLPEVLRRPIEFTPDAPIRVVLTGEKAEDLLEVKNSGPTIEGSVLDQIFYPLKRGPEQDDNYDADGNLGLGLYIVREVALAHGGEVTVRSERGETAFAVRLPRRNDHLSP
jgi:signal transduction histidine kinase